MLARGINPYSVARLVGITVDILERHYAPFIPELRERVRRALDNGEGLEAMPRQNTDPRERKDRIRIPKGYPKTSQFVKSAGDKSVTMDAKKPPSITELAGEPVSRIVRAALQTNKLFGFNRR
jgi:hypothetical protein